MIPLLHAVNTGKETHCGLAVSSCPEGSVQSNWPATTCPMCQDAAIKARRWSKFPARAVLDEVPDEEGNLWA